MQDGACVAPLFMPHRVLPVLPDSIPWDYATSCLCCGLQQPQACCCLCVAVVHGVPRSDCFISAAPVTSVMACGTWHLHCALCPLQSVALSMLCGSNARFYAIFAQPCRGSMWHRPCTASTGCAGLSSVLHMLSAAWLERFWHTIVRMAWDLLRRALVTGVGASVQHLDVATENGALALTAVAVVHLLGIRVSRTSVRPAHLL